MSWWTLIRERPALTTFELRMFSVKPVVWLFVIFAVTFLYQMIPAVSVFHIKGKLLDARGCPVPQMVVGYNYAWKGKKLAVSWTQLDITERMYPRVFESVMTDENGIFNVQVEKEDIGYLTILGFWDKESDYRRDIQINISNIKKQNINNKGRLIPWIGGVVAHYEPGWRIIELIQGWGLRELQVFETSHIKGGEQCY